MYLADFLVLQGTFVGYHYSNKFPAIKSIRKSLLVSKMFKYTHRHKYIHAQNVHLILFMCVHMRAMEISFVSMAFI